MLEFKKSKGWTALYYEFEIGSKIQGTVVELHESLPICCRHNGRRCNCTQTHAAASGSTEQPCVHISLTSPVHFLFSANTPPSICSPVNAHFPLPGECAVLYVDVTKRTHRGTCAYLNFPRLLETLSAQPASLFTPPTQISGGSHNLS
jgi:hypothetical protein